MDKTHTLTIVYAFLVFIGFYNYYIYYDYFDIEIAPFLSVSELLLSFLPLTFWFIVLLASISLLGVMIIMLRAFEGSQITTDSQITKIEAQNYLISYLSNAHKGLNASIKGWKLKSYSSYLSIVYNFFKILIGLVWGLFLIIYLMFYIDGMSGMYGLLRIPSTLLIFLGVVWYIGFTPLISRVINNEKNKIVLQITLGIFMIFGFLSIHNINKAKNVLSGHPEYEIKFENNQNTILSDSSIVFIGITEKYIFLRNLNLEKNLIFKLDAIKELEMKKVSEQTENK